MSNLGTLREAGITPGEAEGNKAARYFGAECAANGDTFEDYADDRRGWSSVMGKWIVVTCCVIR